MKKKIDTREKLFEMMQKVNNVQINENYSHYEKEMVADIMNRAYIAVIQKKGMSHIPTEDEIRNAAKEIVRERNLAKMNEENTNNEERETLGYKMEETETEIEDEVEKDIPTNVEGEKLAGKGYFTLKSELEFGKISEAYVSLLNIRRHSDIYSTREMQVTLSALRDLLTKYYNIRGFEVTDENVQNYFEVFVSKRKKQHESNVVEEEDLLKDVLLGFTPKNVGDAVCEDNYDFAKAEREYYDKEELSDYEKYLEYDKMDFNTLSDDEKEEFFELWKRFKKGVY